MQAATGKTTYCKSRGWWNAGLSLEFLLFHFAARPSPDHCVLLYGANLADIGLGCRAYRDTGVGTVLLDGIVSAFSYVRCVVFHFAAFTVGTVIASTYILSVVNLSSYHLILRPVQL